MTRAGSRARPGTFMLELLGETSPRSDGAAEPMSLKGSRASVWWKACLGSGSSTEGCRDEREKSQEGEGRGREEKRALLSSEPATVPLA